MRLILPPDLFLMEKWRRNQLRDASLSLVATISPVNSGTKGKEREEEWQKLRHKQVDWPTFTRGKALLCVLNSVLPLIGVSCHHWTLIGLKTNIPSPRSVSSKAWLLINATRCFAFITEAGVFRHSWKSYICFCLDGGQAAGRCHVAKAVFAITPFWNAWGRKLSICTSSLLAISTNIKQKNNMEWWLPQHHWETRQSTTTTKDSWDKLNTHDKK